MNKNVLASVFRRYEAVALVVVEPLDRSGRHVSPSRLVTNVQRKAEAKPVLALTSLASPTLHRDRPGLVRSDTARRARGIRNSCGHGWPRAPANGRWSTSRSTALSPPSAFRCTSVQHRSVHLAGTLSRLHWPAPALTRLLIPRSLVRFQPGPFQETPPPWCSRTSESEPRALCSQPRSHA